MATITPGTGGTLQSTTAEGQMVEIINFLQLQEANTAVNTTAADYVQATYNINTLVYAGTFSLPISQVSDSSGMIQLLAQNYLTNSNFSAGTGGTFSSNNPAQYLLEVLIYLKNLENSTMHNPQGKNNVSSSFDMDTLTFSGSINFPVTYSLDNSGNTIFSVNEYLTT